MRSVTVDILTKHSPELRMSPKRSSFAMRKVTFCIVKDGLLECERRPFANLLVISALPTGRKVRPNAPQKRHKITIKRILIARLIND